MHFSVSSFKVSLEDFWLALSSFFWDSRGIRLGGKGTPDFAHMAAALALAISSSWALSRSVRRLGDLLENSEDLDLRRSGDLL